eukprot:Blabericola_migrator_1__2274@NODE_1629_length_4140_cov_9_186840_g1061_i0_p2_GENE_NODE_1629_length_4140_cov_9_186840_g1061_i0NODE_1629_length_4140_cov_9_186840_g1061_i0_p2_ORF_typecomplete_len293_score16_26_NODE_1629_length_4140_cov_9_186840_g1061_i032274105
MSARSGLLTMPEPPQKGEARRKRRLHLGWRLLSHWGRCGCVRPRQQRNQSQSSADTTTRAGETLNGVDSNSALSKELESSPPFGSAGFAECICGFSSHSIYNPEIPIITAPDQQPGSYEEALTHAKSICGHWITIMDRSDSLDAQMQHVGISRMKRAVMNRYTVPFTAILINNETILKSWIGTPLGPKYMHASLVGNEIVDEDNEVGTWAGIASMVDLSIPWFCGGNPVRALQLRRTNPTLGLAFETRVVLPDAQEGKIMLFNIKLYPHDKPPIFVDRILRFHKPLNNNTAT